MASQRLLIRNGFVVSMDPDVGDIPNGDVLVEDGAIVEVGRGLGVSDAEEIDATGMIVMPGFVDTHRHTWQTPVRGVLPCCTLDNYFAVMLGSVGGHYRPEDVHIGNYAGALEALNGGVTTLLDWSHINNTPDHSDAAIQGLKDAGIRAIYAHGVPTGGEWWSFSELNHPEDIRRIRETYFSSDDQLLTLALAARAPGNSNFEVAKHDWELARDLGIRISVHVGMRLTGVHVNHVLTLNREVTAGLARQHRSDLGQRLVDHGRDDVRRPFARELHDVLAEVRLERGDAVGLEGIRKVDLLGRHRLRLDDPPDTLTAREDQHDLARVLRGGAAVHRNAVRLERLL